MTFHGSGHRTLRAYTEIDDAPNVMRDVTLSLRPDWKPEDCFVRLSVGDQLMGSSWFQFTDTEAICEGYTVNEGRISQRYPLKQRIDGFGTHPIAADAWLTSVVDLSRGPHTETHQNILMCSLDHRGATGPFIMRHPKGVRQTFVGRERINGHETIVYAFQQFADSRATYGPDPEAVVEDVPGLRNRVGVKTRYRGKLWLDEETGQLWRQETELTAEYSFFQQPQVLMRLEQEYQPSDFGILTPKKFVFSWFASLRDRQTASPHLELTSRTTYDYGKFTRFDVTSEEGKKELLNKGKP